MGIFDFLLGKTTTNVRFEKDPPGQWITLETPDGISDCFDDNDIADCVVTITENPDYFMILTLPQSIYGIRYVQACECKGMVAVQLAIEKTNYVRLVEKLCSPQECLDIFCKFYATGKVDNLRQYKPVRFNRNPSLPEKS